MNAESTPKGAHEIPAKGPALSVQHQTDIGAQLGRLETILDSIACSLAPMAAR
jgi:hypothetical protein